MTAGAGTIPSAALPDPDSPALTLTVVNAVEALRSGEATTEQAILDAAVHDLYEDHIQGEDACPGCDFGGSPPTPQGPMHLGLTEFLGTGTSS